jgi:uncharacterized protein YndB with AHSA1/START domain
MPWELKHSVIANAPRQTVWEFVSDIGNLARVEGDAVESMTLDGPFQAGTRGATKIRGQEPTHWRLAEVEPPERVTYEMELSGAVVRFAWTYEELADGRTRMSQHIVLEGPGAEAYVPPMEQHLAPNAVQGMERLAEEIAKSAAGK